jgi:hypothetical protein
MQSRADSARALRRDFSHSEFHYRACLRRDFTILRTKFRRFSRHTALFSVKSENKSTQRQLSVFVKLARKSGIRGTGR